MDYERSTEGSSASAPQKKVKPALQTRSKAAGAYLEASSWASQIGRMRRPGRFYYQLKNGKLIKKIKKKLRRQ